MTKAQPKDERLHIRVPWTLLASLDSWRRANHYTTRTAAILELIRRTCQGVVPPRAPEPVEKIPETPTAQEPPAVQAAPSDPSPPEEDTSLPWHPDGKRRLFPSEAACEHPYWALHGPLPDESVMCTLCALQVVGGAAEALIAKAAHKIDDYRP